MFIFGWDRHLIGRELSVLKDNLSSLKLMEDSLDTSSSFDQQQEDEQIMLSPVSSPMKDDDEEDGEIYESFIERLKSTTSTIQSQEKESDFEDEQNLEEEDEEDHYSDDFENSFEEDNKDECRLRSKRSSSSSSPPTSDVCPNILSFYEAFSDIGSGNGCVNIVIEYMNGGSLEDVKYAVRDEEVLRDVSYQVLYFNFLILNLIGLEGVGIFTQQPSYP